MDENVTVNLNELKAKEIIYANSDPLCTIGDLMEDSQNVYEFLVKLTGEKAASIRSTRTSPFLHFWPKNAPFCLEIP